MFNNPNKYMYDARGTQQRSWGKDLTGSVMYTFDEFGFRNFNDYQRTPDYVFFGCSLLFGIGVEKSKVFTNKFNCWNFGLAGKYNEAQVLDCYKRFKSLDIDCKVVFVWRSRDSLPNSDLFGDDKIYHCLPYRSQSKKHIRLLQNIDHDVSGTHWGEKTHAKFGKILCYFLK